MRCPIKCCVLIFVVTIVAVAIRVPRLEQRPMHGDEAVQAMKFGELLEKGQYRYDSCEYHGPTLNYFTLISAKIGSAENLKQVNEFTLRIVPVFSGALLVLLLFLLADGLGSGAVVVGGVLTAVSPAMVFYSRYYIHEMLLVCFTLGVIACGWRYMQSKKIGWALLTGLFLGLVQATKETYIIVFGSMLLALLFVLLMERWQDGKSVRTINGWHLIIAVAAAAAVSVLFYSSFFTNIKGVADSLYAFVPYFSRAGQNQLHIHPWNYYLGMLIYFRLADGPIWSEAIIVFFAGVGLVVAVTRKGAAGVNFSLLRFVGFYTLIMAVLYSAIPYKTPWCLLGFLHGMILLGGVGTAAVVRLAPNYLAKVIVVLILIGGGVHLLWQSYLGSYRYYANVVNPYVYAQPTMDVVDIARRVEEVAAVSPQGHDLHIQVVCPEHDYWPLPWYLRSFPNVGWLDKVDTSVTAAPLIVASSGVESDLIKMLYELPPPGKRELYVPLFDGYMELRPGVELRGYVTKELWDCYQQKHLRTVPQRAGR